MTAEQFRDILAKLGITQAEAARRLGLHRAIINRWWKGVRIINRGNSALIREILLQSKKRTRRTVANGQL